MAALQHSRVQSTVNSQLNAMNRIRSVERRNGQLASVLWDARVIIFIDYLEKGQNINSEYYMALLEHLNDEIKKKTAQFDEKRCCFIKTMHCVTN
jgi:5S rRNA maturation endonuclease (ribonuclease M5)